MIKHEAIVWSSENRWKVQEERVYKVAKVSAGDENLEPEVVSVDVDRIINHQGAAGIDRQQVMAACAQAETHPRTEAARQNGFPQRGFHPAWAGLASAVALGKLDFHHSYFGTESGHPGDTIAPIFAEAQNHACLRAEPRACSRDILSYEIKVNRRKRSASSSITSIMSVNWHRGCCWHWRGAQSAHGGA